MASCGNSPLADELQTIVPSGRCRRAPGAKAGACKRGRVRPGYVEFSHASYRPTRRGSKPLPVVCHPLHGHQGSREARRIVDHESTSVKLAAGRASWEPPRRSSRRSGRRLGQDRDRGVVDALCATGIRIETSGVQSGPDIQPELSRHSSGKIVCITTSTVEERINDHTSPTTPPHLYSPINADRPVVFPILKVPTPGGRTQRMPVKTRTNLFWQSNILFTLEFSSATNPECSSMRTSNQIPIKSCLHHRLIPRTADTRTSDAPGPRHGSVARRGPGG